MRVSVGGRARMVVVGMMVCLLGTAAAQASDRGFQFGVRAGGNLNVYLDSWYVVEETESLGYGAEAGLVAKYSFTNLLSLNAELNVNYRVLGNFKYNGVDNDYESEELDDGGWYYRVIDSLKYNCTEKHHEMAVLVPIMLQFTVIESAPLYVSAGVQFGFPFNNKIDYSCKYTTFDGNIYEKEGYGESDGVSDKNGRYYVDFGLVLGMGWMATPRLGVDFRFVNNLNNAYNLPWRSSLMNFTNGVNYFL